MCMTVFQHFYMNSDCFRILSLGLRSQHSCETALVRMMDSWLNAIDSSKMIGVVLVDFKKAFNLVDHQILPRFDTWSDHILSFLLPLIQDGQLSVTGESVCTKYWLTA